MSLCRSLESRQWQPRSAKLVTTAGARLDAREMLQLENLQAAYQLSHGQTILHLSPRTLTPKHTYTHTHTVPVLVGRLIYLFL